MLNGVFEIQNFKLSTNAKMTHVVCNTWKKKNLGTPSSFDHDFTWMFKVLDKFRSKFLIKFWGMWIEGSKFCWI
jgi:hypothetical protein